MKALAILGALLAAPAPAQPVAPPPPALLPAARQSMRWPAPEARQGVAVDGRHFYAIVNSRIGKYRKTDGVKQGEWAGDRIAIRHLNSCIARRTDLVCANSNYPQTPMASSVEFFDTRTLRHRRSIPLGVRDGSLTWVERHRGRWWAALANYDPPHSHGGRNHRDTRIVIFNHDWAQTGGYALPDSVLQRLAPNSISGGSFGPDGLLYLTGHDAPELYVLRVPRAGPVLDHVATIPAPIDGQAWAWDRWAKGRTIYGITRRSGEVVVMQVPAVP